MPWTLRKLAEKFGGVVKGDDSLEITGIAALSDAEPTQLAPLLHRRYLEAVPRTRAGALLTDRALSRHLRDRSLWLHKAPRVALAHLLGELNPEPTPSFDRHPTAVIDASAKLAERVHVDALVIIQEGASVGQGSVLGPRSIIGRGAIVGDDCLIGAGAMVLEGSRLGDRVRVGPGAVIGSEGFGFLPMGGKVPLRVPQVGSVIIEDDVDIGAIAAVDRATLGNTVIRRGAKIDNLVQVAHNVEIEEGAIIAAQSGLAGSVKVGANALLGGQVGVADHLEIGEGARIAAKTGLVADAAPHSTIAGYPGIPHKTWLRAWGTLLRIIGNRRERER